MNEPTGSSKDGLNEHGRHLRDGHQGLRVAFVKDHQRLAEERAAHRTTPQLCLLNLGPPPAANVSVHGPLSSPPTLHSVARHKALNLLPKRALA